MKTDNNSFRIDVEKCVGCVLCMKACPTKAIRIRNSIAVVKGDRCVDCGECFRVCPHQAIVPLTTSFSDLGRFKYTVGVPSPSSYTQFGWEVMPNQILLALKEIGFDQVYDGAWMCEMVNAAIEIYIRENPDPKPKISTVCPAAVRLVSFLYPDLVSHFIPIETPRELVAKLLRPRLAETLGFAEADIGILNLTPCSAKMISITRPIGLRKSALDGAISIQDIYGELHEAVQSVHEDVILQQSSGVGLGWAVAGGEVRGISRDNCLAVSGVWDVIHILDDLEAGKLKDIDYLECLACPDGCVGGPLNVENRHVAKKRAESLVKMFGEKSRVSRKMISELYSSGFFALDKKMEAHPFPPLDKHPSHAIQKRQMIEEVIPRLGGRECGACGAPDCKTFARDIVMKEAVLKDCIFLKKAVQKGDSL